MAPVSVGMLRCGFALALLLATATAYADRPKLAVVKAFAGLDLVETINEVTHTHRGAPATVNRANMTFDVRDGKTHVVTVKKLAMLHRNCNETAWTSRKGLAVTGYEVHDWDDAVLLSATKQHATLPQKAGRYSVHAKFAGISEYNACDAFAFATTVDVDGHAAEVELPLQVIREESRR